MYSNSILLFLQCYTFCLFVNASTITTVPEDTDAIVGGNTTLYCTVDGLGSNTVVWKRFQSSTEYSHNRTVVESTTLKLDRYKIIGDDGTFNLQITGVLQDLEDQINYQCIITDSNGDFLVGSDGAKLSVHDEPMSPTCTVDDNLEEGDTVPFECIFNSRISNVEMNLLSNSDILLNATVEPDKNAGRSTLSTSVTVTAADDGALLRCTVDNQIFNMPYECSVTINVKHEPIVEITQNGMLSNGNASFTCGAVSNPDATQFKWNLCLGDTDMECIDPGEGTLTLEQEDSEEGLPMECEVFGSNVSCQVFKNGETELPVYVILIDDNLTIPDNMTLAPCLLECSVMNAIGEGNDNFTIDNTICVMAIEPTTTIMSTTLNPTTMISTTMLPSTTNQRSIAVTTETDIITTVAEIIDDKIKDYYYIIGGLAGGTVVLFVITIVILLYRRSKSDPDEDTTVTATQWTHYQNTGYDDNGGFEEEPKDDKVLYTQDNPFKTFGKGNETESSTHEYDNIHDKDTLPVNGDNTRLEPEGEVNQEEALPEANVDAVDHSGVNDHVENGSNGDVAINMNDDPQYAVVNKSSFRNEPKSEPSLDNVEGVEYTMDSNPYYETSEKRPSVTQI